MADSAVEEGGGQGLIITIVFLLVPFPLPNTALPHYCNILVDLGNCVD
jgi:hypothetical protein